MNFSSEEKTNNFIPIIKKFWVPIVVATGVMFYFASKGENSVEDNNQNQQQEQQGSLAQDPVYIYTNNLIAQLNTYPQCVMLAKAMRDMASSQAPDQIRVRQVDKIFSKIPDMCIRQ
jgi:flagellar basal body-associated protein FliL